MAWNREMMARTSDLKRCMSRLLISNKLDCDRKPTAIDVLTHPSPGSLD